MIDVDELELIRSSVAHVLDTVAASSIPGALLDLGWAELLESDPAEIVRVTAEEHGCRAVASPILDLVALAAAGLPVTASVAVVLPPLARAASASATVDHGVLLVDGVALAGHDRADDYLVLGGEALWQVPTAALKTTAITGGDPSLGLVRVVGEIPTDAASLVGTTDEVQLVVAAGRRFLSSELLGLADAMLAGARTYVLGRHQYGHPIGAFQAVKHRLADVHVAIAASRAGVTTAWADRSGTSAIAAKCLAGRAHVLAASHCHQVQGGIAFTAEHGFHRLIRRGHLLDALLGPSRELTRTLGAQLIADGSLPRTPRVSA